MKHKRSYRKPKRPPFVQADGCIYDYDGFRVYPGDDGYEELWQERYEEWGDRMYEDMKERGYGRD